jgi:hypothetical protein
MGSCHLIFGSPGSLIPVQAVAVRTSRAITATAQAVAVVFLAFGIGSQRSSAFCSSRR